MNAFRISVVCIFHDEERFLAEAIESVLAQDFDDFELLLVDDGSSDGSGEIARRYAARDPARVRYLEHPGHANRGSSAARNLGLREARGEFITWLDGDDRIRPGKLSAQIDHLARNSSAGMVCGGYTHWRSWSGGKDETYLCGHRSDRVAFAPELTLQVYPLGWAKNPVETLIRRDIAIRVGGFEETFPHLYDDQTFYSKAFLETGALFCDESWLDYREHDESCTAQISWHEYVSTRARFLDWFEGYVALRDVTGKEAILRRLRAERRKVRGLLRPWLLNKTRRAWVELWRLAGRREQHKRHCLTA